MTRNLVLGLMLLAPLAAADNGVLRAGAARIEITPPEGAALPMSGYAARREGFKGIHDRLYVRAIVVDDGATQAALVAADLSAISDSLWDRLSARIAAETKIPRDQILLAATHTHAGPSLGKSTDDDASAKAAAYLAEVEHSFVEAVRQAQAKLQPARVGAGTGKANVNVNRRARTAKGGLWLGRDPDGPSDKTLAVVKLEALSGDPIAIFMNYGVHGTVLGPKNYQVSGDLPGAAARFVEQQFADKVVALWTSGAAGDQAPIYSRAETYDDVAVLGQILGEEAVRVARDLRMSDRARIRGLQKVVTCPGQKVPPGPRRINPQEYKFEDAGPVGIRLSLLMINHVAITGVSGEVLTMIAQRLKKESPFSHTIMVTNCNGSSGYLPDDASYRQISYEIVSARVKPGCAESAIVNGLLEMMDQY